jgi:DNA segregation ATPase FtsK/SpoIIIE, S-DNA-T family
MNAHMITLVIAGIGVLGVVVWLLAKAGKVLVKIAEALAAAAVVLLAVWLVVKALLWAMRQTVTYWRTSLTVLAILAWWHWWGWVPLVIVLGSIGLVLAGWRLVDLASFDAWAGRHLRAGGCGGPSTRRSCPSGCTPAGSALKTTPPRS